jgi:hypothetical protein
MLVGVISLLAGYVEHARLAVLVDVILGVKKALGLFCGRVELDPLGANQQMATHRHVG